VTGIETIAFGVLWLVAVLLAFLVLALYRQVDRAYALGESQDYGGLPAGVEAPPIEIVGSRGIEPLTLDPDELTLLTFVTTTCDSCRGFIDVLGEGNGDYRVIVLVNGEETREFRDLKETVEMKWLAHPPDVVRSFGVAAVPQTYAVKAGRVVGSSSATSAAGVRGLIREAQQRLGAPPSDANGGTELHSARQIP
jgi:hypothetical protein